MEKEHLEKLAQAERVLPADDPESALLRASREMRTPPQDIEIKEEEPKKYRARIVKRNGFFGIQLSPDGYQAVLEYLLPPIGSGSPVTVDQILEALQSKSVIYGIDRKAIQVATEHVAEDRTPCVNVVVARGTPPVDGQDASLEFTPERLAKALQAKGPDRPLVRKGTAFAKKTPPTPAKYGTALNGQKVSGEAGEDRTPQLGSGSEIGEDGTIKAAVSGYLELERCDTGLNSLQIEPCVQISKDALEATLTIYPPGGEEPKPTPQTLLELLQEAGVVEGIRQKDLPKICRYVLERKKPVQQLLVAQGRPPESSHDGSVTYSTEIIPRVGTIKNDGSVDFRERGFLKSFKAGEVVAQKVPPKPGRPGVTVRGEPIEAEPGKEARLVGGKHIEVSADGEWFRAGQDGVLKVAETGEVSIVELVEIPGDVDYSVGNLNVNGSLSVGGAIKPEFSLEAKGDILIRGAVEAARVVAGGSVAVAKGIVGKDKAFIRAGIMLTAQYAEAATLISGGNIEIVDSLMHCRVFCDGCLDVTGRSGRLSGGTYVVRQQIRAKEIGTSAGVHTHCVLGIEREAYLQIESLRGQIEALRQETRRLTSEDQIKKRYMRLIEESEAQLNGLLQAQPLKYPSVRIEVLGRIYPGVELTIGTTVAKISEPLSHVVFVFDEQKQALIYESLS